MDAAQFQETVEESNAVELERLGSSKLLVALTDATLTEETVLRTAAGSERAAMETLETWIDDEDHDDAREFFVASRDQEREHYDRITAMLEDGEVDAGSVDPMHERLRSLETPTARLGGLVGRALVSDRTHLQLVGFFVNEGDEQRADCFRELRTETATQGDRAAELLADVCAGNEDWDRARTVAEDVIDVAYDAYADSLDELGLDPKPIC
ncbi:rubrerythrin family protein [Natrinema longum]|uniref:Rubrerythrin family protein n=1 Tax=Natrinema longum TaxID=370324 RepID=A0A8A2U5W0_9EURY|nr:rubrerythrin family protein [Natrinema longum]MBZ6494638.1 rubrerythrin family protein [Natrinema longum]QSW84046.1 rubrerythrin family protein [Natrinema longum]